MVLGGILDPGEGAGRARTAPGPLVKSFSPHSRHEPRVGRVGMEMGGGRGGQDGLLTLVFV